MEAGAEAALGAQLFALFLAPPGRRSGRRCPRAAAASGHRLGCPGDPKPPLGAAASAGAANSWASMPTLPSAACPAGGTAGPSTQGAAAPAPAPALHGLRSDGSGHAGLRAGRGGALPGRLRPGCGLRLLRPGDIPGAEGEGERIRPHILHLTGHGAVKEGKGYFAFEKEDGTADLVPAEELRRFLGLRRAVRLSSGCRTGKAPCELSEHAEGG